MYDTPEFTATGGLMSYGPSLVEMYRQLGIYTEKFCMVRSQLTCRCRYRPNELAINLKTANALGITLPPSLVARADEVIE